MVPVTSQAPPPGPNVSVAGDPVASQQAFKQEHPATQQAVAQAQAQAQAQQQAVALAAGHPPVTANGVGVEQQTVSRDLYVLWPQRPAYSSKRSRMRKFCPFWQQKLNKIPYIRPTIYQMNSSISKTLLMTFIANSHQR